MDEIKIPDDTQEIKTVEDKIAGLMKPEGTLSEETLNILHVHGIELWHSEGTAYMTITVNGHKENWSIRSEMGRKYPQKLFYQYFGKPLPKNSLEEVLQTLEAEAFFDGLEHKVFTRVGVDDQGNIYHDLCNNIWSVVKIAPSGIGEMKYNIPIKFVRSNDMLPLPIPTCAEYDTELELLKYLKDIENTLWQLLNLVDGDGVSEEEFNQIKRDRVFAMSWLLAALNPSGPYPILYLTGEKGSIKSSFSKTLARITDPRTADLVKLPKEDQDLFVLAKNRWVLGFDNNSGVPADIADALCSISTGGGYGSRQLYTNDEVNSYNVTRPMILNGIGNLTNRPDLIDRMLPICTRPPKDYIRESELKEIFDELLPHLLLYLYKMVQNGLFWQKSIKLEKYPRMADFTHWISSCATESYLFFNEDEFLKYFNQAINQTWADIADSDLFIRSFKKFVDSEAFKGFENKKIYPAELWEQIILAAEYNPDHIKDIPDSLPKTSRLLDSFIQRNASVLRTQGIDIKTFNAGRKYYTIKKTTGQQDINKYD